MEIVELLMFIRVFYDLGGITQNTECFSLQLPVYQRHNQVELAVYIGTGSLLETSRFSLKTS